MMGWTCCVPDCTSGNPKHPGPPSIRYFRLPLNDPDLLREWLRRIQRKNFLPSKYSRICSLHFNEHDFSTASRDSNVTRKRKRPASLDIPYLIPTAIPSNFHGRSSYFSCEPPPKRSLTTSASHRLELENQKILLDVDKLNEDDRVKDLDDLAAKFSQCVDKPHGFFHMPSSASKNAATDTCLLFLNVDATVSPPRLLHSLQVHEDLRFSAFSYECPVSAKQLRSCMLNTAKIQSFTDFLNLLAFLNCRHKEISPIRRILHTIEECMHQEGDVDEQTMRRLAFWHEQIQLSGCVSTKRQFTSTSLVSFILLHSSSTAAYRTLMSDNLLIMPSERHLRRLCKSLSGDSRESNLQYLQARRSTLNEYEATVTLIFDEIYVHQRLDYTKGQFQGLSIDGSTPCSSVLCFMLKSLASKYVDVIAMVPLARMNVQILEYHFRLAMQLAIDAGFSVCGTVCDNHPVNRHFFKENLGGGELKAKVEHPLNSNEAFYAIPDSTHAFKNVYNNFQKRKVFQLPPFGEHPPMNADFSHVEALFKFEKEMPLRMAHKVTETVLNPTSIQRASAKMVWALLDDSTIAAFKYYIAKYDKPWSGTLHFLELMSNLGKIVNVKSASIGIHKRDPLRQPILGVDDQKLDELRKYSDFFRRWKESGKKGLSSETFAAITLMCDALPLVACHLITQYGYRFVLLGHLQSDAIEGRFGRYRQLSGANFFISYRQLCESEKKIKIESALRHSQLCLEDVKKCFEEPECSLEVHPDAISVAEPVCFALNLEENEINIIFYVAGYIAHSHINCESCSLLLRREMTCPTVEMDECTADCTAAFFSYINRGGLKCPSSGLFELCVLGYTAFSEIKTTPVFIILLRAKNAALLFADAVNHAMQREERHYRLSGCDNHTSEKLVRRCLVRLFNILAKKMIADFANPSLCDSQSRKILKLRSSST